ncbi:MAG: hypothetical protein RLZZ490_2213 [Cyanobacteriota bacterium]
MPLINIAIPKANRTKIAAAFNQLRSASILSEYLKSPPTRR